MNLRRAGADMSSLTTPGVEDVRRYGRRSWRVHGTIDGGGRDRPYSGRYGDRAFTRTVRDDGRVKLKTKRIRY